MALMLSEGCRRETELMPVHGRVTYQGRPLEFGAVKFQHSSGRLVSADIQPDGTFRLFTLRKGEGVEPGRYTVRITCFESQRPGANVPTDQEIPDRGPSLIPLKYDDYLTSGLEIDVGPDMSNPVVFDLT
jgi:hypothetical protein